MPVTALWSSAPCDAALERLSSRIDSMATAVDGAYNALAALKDAPNFPEAKKNAEDALSSALDVVNGDSALCFREVGKNFHDFAMNIFEKYADEKYPVTAEGLGKVNEWLPTDRLEQFSYLMICEFAKAVHAAHGDGTVDPLPAIIQLDPEAMCYTTPDDMHARTILTRTTLYLQTLREQDNQDGWFYATMEMIGELGAEIEKRHNELQAIRETVTSSEMNEVAIKALDDPEMMKAKIASIDHMLIVCGELKTFLTDCKSLCDNFYQKLGKALLKSQEAIMLAYRIYVDAHAITF